ncbi:hypothetical protein NDU88_004219 [Pleurodeles waltl]|uniref:Uncharacterized protein n=1 Tax=Pleurodeles waltl TaxID=8319 RepID=A0AAV7UES0_PLEWA|nr:hypothetical protein NDU88_004219 [Pleurodeles waltl]
MPCAGPRGKYPGGIFRLAESEEEEVGPFRTTPGRDGTEDKNVKERKEHGVGVRGERGGELWPGDGKTLERGGELRPGDGEPPERGGELRPGDGEPPER